MYTLSYSIIFLQEQCPSFCNKYIVFNIMHYIEQGWEKVLI